MWQRLLYYFLTYGVDALAILLTIVALWRPVSRRSSWIWWAAALLGLAFIGRTIYSPFLWTNAGWCGDFRYVWWGGAYALQGKDPYTVQGFSPPDDKITAFVYPPFTLPFFELFALAPLPVSEILWTSLNVLICLSLGWLTRRALIAQDGEQVATLPLSLAALLTAPVILSITMNLALAIGQPALLVTFALLAALTMQACKPPRPAVTAAFLALASIKVQTLAPFLLLFLRRRDRRTWLLLGLMGAALMLGAGNPADLPRKFSAFFDANLALRQPGHGGDYSLSNRKMVFMFGFQHLFSRLGIVHGPTAMTLSLACILGLGAYLAYLAWSRPTLPRGALCALVSLYSMLFIYHQLYDLPILIIPLFYSASRLHATSGPARWCYAWVIAAVLLALNEPYGEFLRLQTLYSSSALVRILVLPSLTYLILTAMLALLAAATLEARQSAPRAALVEGRPPTPVLVEQKG
jgi:hypothetical protein